MYANRRIDINLAQDYNDENAELIQFYERNLRYLKTCSTHAIPSHVLSDVAVKINHSKLFRSDWQEYATNMGIMDNLLLAKIEASADVSKELPLFVAMTAALQHNNGSVAHIIKAFLNTKRLDVLKDLKPHIEKILKNCTSTEVKGFTSDTEQLSCIRSKNPVYLPEITKEKENEGVSLNSIDTDDSQKVCSIELNPASLERNTACEFNTLQQSSINRNYSSEVQIYPSSKPNEPSSEEGRLQEINLFPSAPSDETLSVFIQHTEFDIDVAKQLSAKLREEGFTVTTMFDMDKLIVMDSTGALSTIFQEVSFIIPIVSLKFLQQIHPQVYEKYLESTDAVNNRNLYQLIMNEYRNRRCVNFRVRPVILPDMKRQLLINDIILSYSFRLWNEVPKLIRILKETRELIPRYPFH